MFWIGMIVGMLILAGATFGWVAYCFAVTGVTRDEFDEITNMLGEAVANRESTIQVWHDGELIESAVLAEKK